MLYCSMEVIRVENTVETVENVIQIGRGPNNRIRLWRTEELQQYREYHIADAPVRIGDRLHAWWGWLTVTRIQIHHPEEWEFTGSMDCPYVFATCYCEDTMGLPEVPYQICWRNDNNG